MSTVRTTAAIALVAASALALSACGGSATGSGGGPGAGNRTVVALLPQGYDQPYGSTYVDEMKKKAKELGINLDLQNAQYDASKQASQCDVAVAKKPAGIVLWPADASTVRPCLLKAQAAKIPVNSTNSDVLPSDKSLVHAYSGPSNDQVGRLDADLLAQGLHNKGNIVVVEGQPGNSTAVDRLNGFKDQLAKKYPEIHILGTQPANWDKGQAVTATSELMTRYGSQVNGIYAQDDTMAAGAIQALQQRGIKPASIVIVGCGNTKLGQPNVLNGLQYGTLFQSPVWDADHAMELIDQAMKGQAVPADNFMPMPQVTKDNAKNFPPEW